jgi:hypothetical protein
MWITVESPVMVYAVPGALQRIVTPFLRDILYHLQYRAAGLHHIIECSLGPRYVVEERIPPPGQEDTTAVTNGQIRRRQDISGLGSEIVQTLEAHVTQVLRPHWASRNETWATGRSHLEQPCGVAFAVGYAADQR